MEVLRSQIVELLHRHNRTLLRQAWRFYAKPGDIVSLVVSNTVSIYLFDAVSGEGGVGIVDGDASLNPGLKPRADG